MAQIINGKKTFIPLENNPEVMARLAHNLGVSPSLGFHDVYSLTDPDLLAIVPRPAHALLFTCHAKTFHPARDAENATMKVYTGSGPQEPVVWFKQTIGHACGLIGLLHCLANGDAKAYIEPGSGLEKLLKDVTPLDPAARAQFLYDSEFLEKAHMDAAVKGDTSPPSPADHVGNHYIAFVKAADGHLWELNGGMKGPVDRGVLSDDEDVLSEKAVQSGVKTFMTGDDIRFSMLALAPKFD